MKSSPTAGYYAEGECNRSDVGDIATKEMTTSGQIRTDFHHENDNSLMTSSNNFSSSHCSNSSPQQLIDFLACEFFPENTLQLQTPYIYDGFSNCLDEIEDLMKTSIDDGGEVVQSGHVKELPSSTPQLPDQSIFTSNCSLMTAEQYEKNMKRALKNKRANETKIRNKQLKKDTKNVK